MNNMTQQAQSTVEEAFEEYWSARMEEEAEMVAYLLAWRGLTDAELEALYARETEVTS